MPSVLVAYASSRGSTREVAERITQRLKQQLPPPTTVACESVSAVPLVSSQQPGIYSAVVVGSAIHAGRWISPGQRFITQNGTYLSSSSSSSPGGGAMPVWAFSVEMPRNDKMQRDEEAAVLKFLRAHLDGDTDPLRGHALFQGRFLRSDAPWYVRPFLMFINDENSFRDARDWDAIEAWADQVGREMMEAGVGKNVGGDGA